MKTASQELNLMNKEFDSDFSIFWPHFRICIESIVCQNCNYSRTNETIGLKFSETFKTNFFLNINIFC